MNILYPNDIKIYDLSSGKSLPEWLSDRKKRALQKNDLDVQRRIELIQDFEMPAVSNCVQITPDQHYILTTGMYKPRVRCYDVGQLSMKFERCMDCEVVKFHVLSPDYSKIVFLQSDRHIEFHSQQGRYYKLRIPKNGRDLAFHEPSCDMYFVGASPEVYRLNLEQGRFLKPLKTSSQEVNCCQFNPVHNLLSLGTSEGRVDCWDPRVKNRVGVLDAALSARLHDSELKDLPAITSLQNRDGLTFAAGTSTGQVLIYDLRSDKPLLVKDHRYGLPIKNIRFQNSMNLVLSCDTRILKIWDKDSGKAFTSVEPGTKLNDLCLVPETGMVFLANEAPKLKAYYIPGMGPAPKWCSFLDSLTEEMEENPAPAVYDDYKFVTRTELDNLGLSHLIGSSLLRAYMHGFFIDIRLYRKAKAISDPFAYEDFVKSKIREKIEEKRQSRVKVKKLPQVNKDLAAKLLDQEDETVSTKKKQPANILKDDRFSQLFSDANFHIDTESEDYQLLNPLVTKLDRDKKRKKEKMLEIEENFTEVQEADGVVSEEESSDDERGWTEEVKKQHKMLRKQGRGRGRREEDKAVEWDEDITERNKTVKSLKKPKFLEIQAGADPLKPGKKQLSQKLKKQSLGERLKKTLDSEVVKQGSSAGGNLEMTFQMNSKRDSKKREESSKHHSERKKIRRSAGKIMKPRQDAAKYWMGRKVR